jgi:hypothetical protein
VRRDRCRNHDIHGSHEQDEQVEGKWEWLSALVHISAVLHMVPMAQRHLSLNEAAEAGQAALAVRAENRHCVREDTYRMQRGRRG